jgi:cytochrome c oxidase subunit 3
MAAEVKPHDHGHVHGLAHQFETLEQQKESATLGMWIFLVTEVLFFGGLFLMYAVYRWSYPESFIAGSRSLNVTLGTINTAVLILSSLTMALAVRAAQLGKGRACASLLVATILLGGVFLGIKAKEYYDKFQEHHVPGASFHFEPEAESDRGPSSAAPDPRAPSRALSTAPHAQMYFNLYFAMTGLHAFHMIIGVGIILFVVVWAWQGRYTPQNHNFVEGIGLYWHFVDLIWIFLFPLLYLVGRHH